MGYLCTFPYERTFFLLTGFCILNYASQIGRLDKAFYLDAQFLGIERLDDVILCAFLECRDGPSIPGILRSTRTASYGFSPSMRCAEKPFSAPSESMSSIAKNFCIVSLIFISSSTIRTFNFCLSCLYCYPLRLPQVPEHMNSARQ